MDYVPATLFSIFRTNITKQTKLEIERIVDYSRKILSALAYLDVNLWCNYSKNVFVIGISNPPMSSLMKLTIFSKFVTLVLPNS